jgi:putative FmdB family regulatory protein
MPTYEYQCEKCDKTFEVTQSMKDGVLKTCPKELCPRKVWGKGRVKRLIGTGAGLIFKGSGFYITDYRSEGYKAAARSDSKSGETTKTETKSETKSDAKTESKPAPAETKAAPKPPTKKD